MYFKMCRIEKNRFGKLLLSFNIYILCGSIFLIFMYDQIICVVK